MSPEPLYFPAVVRSLHDSPIDALVALAVPRDEAMDLVAASWSRGDRSLVAWIDGGRPVAVVRTPEGRWAACNAFLDQATADPDEAARRLTKLAKRGRRGLVGVWHGGDRGAAPFRGANEEGPAEDDGPP